MARSELILIRHAPADAAGRLCGRTDVPARADCLRGLDWLRDVLDDVPRRVSSPALRCRQTADALWPDAPLDLEARLVEQDFGAWDGLPAGDVPDLGPLSRSALAAHRPPGGESFDDLCDRVWPALRELAAAGGPVAIVAHAGTIRAALALALGTAAPALAFEVAPLSVTRLLFLPGGWTIACAGCRPA